LDGLAILHKKNQTNEGYLCQRRKVVVLVTNAGSHGEDEGLTLPARSLSIRRVEPEQEIVTS
jgi:hypothetical protein